MFIAIPKTVVTTWCHRPWDEVLAAAEAGIDGLSVETASPRLWLGRDSDNAPERPDVAFFRKGDHRLSGRAVLFQQNY